MQIPFGPWEPDKADLGANSLDVARNVLPGANSWRPFQGLTTESDALAAACKGIAYVQQTSGQYITYVATATKIYRLDPTTQTFVDVSRLVGGDYNVPADQFWSFAQINDSSGNKLVAVNLGDNPQVIDVDTGSNFDALAGSPPVAKFAIGVGEYLILAHLTTDPAALAWSDFNDITEWVAGVSDVYAFASGGAIQAVCPAAGMVILERGLRRMMVTGDENVFRFPDDIIPGKGTIAPYGVVQNGALCAWLAEDGFYRGHINEQQNISVTRVTRYFFDAVYRDRLWQIYAAADPFATRWYWAFPTADTAYNDRIIGYDWSLDRWFEAEVDTYVLARTATAGVTMEGLDSISASLDALTISLDSRVFQGGAPVFAAINLDLELAYFEGDNLAATLETGNYQFVSGRRSRVRHVLPFIEGAGGSGLTVQIGKRQRLADTPVMSPVSVMQPSGRCPTNADAYYHKLKFSIPAAADWSHIQGAEVDFAPTSER